MSGEETTPKKRADVEMHGADHVAPDAVPELVHRVLDQVRTDWRVTGNPEVETSRDLTVATRIQQHGGEVKP